MGISKNAFVVAAAFFALLSVAGCGRYVNDSATAGDPAPSLALPPAPASVVAVPNNQTSVSVAGVTLADEPLDPNAIGVQVTSANTVVSPPTVASTVPPVSLPAKTTVPQSATTKATPTPTVATKSVDYTVKDGDTLSVIAQNNGVKLSSLAAFNGISDRDTLKPGQVLKIPQ